MNKTLLVFLLFATQVIHASFARHIELADTASEISVSGNNYFVFEDAFGAVTKTEILTSKNQNQFIPFDAIDNKKNCKAYWVKFSVKASGATKAWFIEVVDPHIQEIDFFELNQGVLESKLTKHGFNYPFSVKAVPHKNYLYQMDLADGKLHEYYFRFSSSYKNHIGLKIRSAEYVIGYSVVEYFFLGLYYGILLIMAIYNLFLYFSTKERIYVFYILYVGACALVSLQEDGLGFQFIWNAHPVLNSYISNYSQLLLLVAFTLYANAFLAINSTFRWYNYLVYALLVLSMVTVLINALVFENQFNVHLYFLLTYSVIFFTASYMLLKRIKGVSYFLFGFSFVYISLVVFYFRTIGIDLIHHFFAVYSFNYAIIIELVIFSFALSDRLKREIAQKELAQVKIIDELKEKELLKDKLTNELELKVAERTAELKIANEAINRMNKSLASKNVQLQNDVKQITKERVMQKEMSLDEFKQTYPNEDSCYTYLAELKWGKSYACKKCGHEKFSLLPKEGRRCTKCKYIESVTAFTIFHSLKFSILEAFYVLFLVSIRKDISAEELSKLINLSVKSCANFKRKIFETELQLKGKHKDKSGWEKLILSE